MTAPIDPLKLKGLIDSDFRAPDMIGHVEGWRAWRVRLQPPAFSTAPQMRSVSFAYSWTPRVKARAECSRCDEIPGAHCQCGFYSAKTLDHLREMRYHTYDAYSGWVCVVGKLANWGRVIEGTQGWRAEFAYPVILYVPFEAWKLGAPLKEAYGVPVRLLNLLDPTKHPDEGTDV